MTPEQEAVRMTTVEALAQSYYGRSDLLQRIEARLRAAGVERQKLGFRDLHPFDQLHGLGILATEEHVARAGVRAGMHALDLGCGLAVRPATWLPCLAAASAPSISRRNLSSSRVSSPRAAFSQTA